MQLAQHWARSKLLGATPAVEVVATTAPATPADTAPAAGPAPGTLPAASPAAAAIVQAPAISAPAAATVAPAVSSAQPAATGAPKKTDTPAPAKPANPAAAVPAKAAVTAEAIEAPAEAMAAQAWLKPMPAGTYVVQHAAMPTYDAALQWQKSQAALSAARIVAVYRPNQKMAYFIVVSGPFASRELAFNFTRSRGVPAETWVRTASSLREQFTPEQTTAAKR